MNKNNNNVIKYNLYKNTAYIDNLNIDNNFININNHHYYRYYYYPQLDVMIIFSSYYYLLLHIYPKVV